MDENEATLRARIAQLEEQVRARDEFIAVLGHELRNPVSPVYVQLEHLRRSLERAGPMVETADVVDKLTRLRARVQRFLAVLDRLADVSLLQSGTIELRRELVDLRELCVDLAGGFESELAAASCALRLRADEPVIGLWDRFRVEQIVGNVLANAIRYGAGAPIELSVRADGSIATIEVRDRGIGIAPSDRARIFERFERASPRAHRGALGIGLWLAKRLTTAMDGTIEVESEPGEGALFRIRLPMVTG